MVSLWIFAGGSKPPLIPIAADTPRSFETKDAIVKALFTTLGAAWLRRVAYAELLASTRQRLDRTGVLPPGDFEHQFLARLFDACGRKLVDFPAEAPLDCAPAPSPAPRVDPLTRLMAAQGLPVVNAWHESLPLDAASRALLATLDGTRELFSADERRHLAEFAAAGLFVTD